MAKQEKAISRIYGQAFNYCIESKWSQGYKYKRQICSGIAMSFQLLDSPRAFSATRPGNQELLETPYPLNFPYFYVCLYSWCCTSFRSRWPEGSFIQLFRIYPIILSWALLQYQHTPYNNLSLFVTEALTRVPQMMSVSGSRSGAVRGILSSFPVPSLQELCHAVLLPLQIFLHCCAQDCRSQHPVSGICKDPVQWWGVPGNTSKPCRNMRRLGKCEGWGVCCLSERELGNRSGK